MPLYEFRCKKCETVYEELCRKIDADGKCLTTDDDGKYIDISCPKCKSISKHKLNSCPAEAIFTNPEGTKKWISGSGGHDYRFKSKQPKIAAERALVEQVSHVGPMPYNAIDDISSGKHFGDVK